MRASRAILLVIGLLAGARLAAAPAESIEVLRALRGSEGLPRGNMVVSPDGTVFGVTQYGGTFGGSIFALHPDGGGGYTYEELYAFQTETGYQPQAGLTIGSDGLLYGTTSALGGVGSGTVFRFDPATRQLTNLHEFNDADGSWPYGSLIEGEPLVFYGTTRLGGTMQFGTVFRMDTNGNGSFTTLHFFQGTDGRNPFGRLYRAPNGDLFGTASGGASLSDDGCVFEIDSQGAYSVLHAFQGGATDGSKPHGGLTLGPDGNVYGTTWGGGASGLGTIFRIVSGSVALAHSFSVAEGSVPNGDLNPDGAGGLLGATVASGANDLGTAYRFTLPGTLDVLHSFQGGSDGEYAESGPVADSQGGVVGLTEFGGLHGVGVAYRIASGQESVLLAFEIEAAHPLAPLVTGSDAKLYGVAGRSVPSIFRWDPIAGTFESLVSVRDTDPNLLQAPWGALAETPDGWFYGTSAGSPFEDGGSVWRAKLDGTVETLHSFLGGTDHLPMTGLTLSADGSLYGTTTEPGNLFRVDPPDGDYVPLHTFTDPVVGPCGRLIETTPGVFFGVSGGGGTDNAGTIYQFAAPSTVTIAHDFGADGSGAVQPCSDLTLGSDSAFYVTTRQAWDVDGSLQHGGAYRVSSSGTDRLCLFRGDDGATPTTGLTESASNGVFYGTTLQGGAANYGKLYRIDGSDRCDMLYEFDGTRIGGSPQATMLRAPDGYLYGTTYAGGWFGGTLFRISAGMPLVTVAPASGPADGGTPITITGTNFEPNASVSLGGVALPDAQVGGPTSATATTTALPPGTLHHVLVLNPDRSAGMVIDGWLADFLDVPQADPFHAYIEEVVRRHVAAGFGDGNYGRNSSVTRAQMAVLLLKARHGSAYAPPQCLGSFADVPCPSLFADWVERLAGEGITAGCGGGNYCPDAPVRRDQMAAFLLKAEHGSGYVPPSCTGVFGDVACPSLFADWIERLAAENVTAGCGGGDYCPLAPNTRGQMAVFLTRVFFPLP